MASLTSPRIELSLKELTKFWNTWVQDKSLQGRQRFGQYVLNRYPVVWPECYYAETNTAYEFLLKETKEYRSGLVETSV